MKEERGLKSGGLDYFKMVAAFLVVAIHTSPLTSFSVDADFFWTRILARVAVPFFFMVTGQFVLSDAVGGGAGSQAGRIVGYLKKIAVLYGISIVLYIPVGIYAEHYKEVGFGGILRMLVFDGTFYHLWYFPACILGALLIILCSRVWKENGIAAAAAILYAFGLLGDSYYGLISDVPVISDVYEGFFSVFSYTRNGIFFAPLFLLLGVYAGRLNNDWDTKGYGIGFLVSLSLMTVEGFLLRSLEVQHHDSMYVCLIPCAFFLYRFLLSLDLKTRPRLRSVSTWIYVLHPLVIVLVRGVAKKLGQTGIMVDNSLIFYLLVCVGSFIAAECVVWILARFQKKPFLCGRAWIELSENALRQNVSLLQSRLPKECRLMPAMKADAYGHGMVPVAKKLNRMGIDAFCVASAAEGARLRLKGVKGEILVLGYTHPMQFGLLSRYRLTQTVIDYEYAKQLNQYGKKLRVHVGVDTGMHRLGEPSRNRKAIHRICRMRHLKITGMYTHFSASGLDSEEGEAFTHMQAKRFYQAADVAKRSGCEGIKLHMQASYGVFRYPEYAADFARVGIALYGVLSSEEDLEDAEGLLPVLSLKARVAAVKEALAGEYVGYDLAYCAERDRKVAVLSIGYGDGVPRSLSNGVGYVLINGVKAPIVGNICMDQMTVDVSDAPDVKAGDVATLIGKSGKEEITAYDYARWAGTITNEILSRLGARLERGFLP